MAHLMGSVLFLVHIVASLAAPTSPRANGSDPQVGERWFGVREDFEIRPQDARAWPACADGSRTVPYCFGDVDTYQELSEVFAMGLAIWAPAMRVSSLAFAPDPACVQEPCLCSEPGVGEETLHIMLDPGRVAAASSLGYDPLFRDPNQPTHRLLWPANRAFTSHSAAPVLMAHELGHVIGLHHEHQRSDAGQYVRYDCRALGGYEAAKARVAAVHTGEQAFSPGMSADEKMGLVCNDMLIAERYFSEAANFMPHPNTAQEFRLSREFDYNSIMIYGSTQGIPFGSTSFPLLGISGDFLWMGGSSCSDDAGISQLDIDRVTDLYPPQSIDPHFTPGGPPSKRSNTTNSTHSKQPWLKVVVAGDFTTTVGPVPTGFPKSSNDPKALELLRKYDGWGFAESANISGSKSNKRWYSVPLDDETSPDNKRTWPACNDGTHTITYCFEDEAAHKDLNELFARALAKWAPAMHESSLDFAPDAACTGDLQSRCLCSTPGVAEITLHIVLTEHGGAEASLGYREPSLPKLESSKPRHYIFFPADPDFYGAAAPVHMAHEIGHVVGFGHEHQRPDARQKLKFDCLALAGYDKAKKKVEAVGTDDPMFTPSMSIKEKMDLVCKLQDLAQKYFTQAGQYLPREDELHEANSLQHSGEFDYNSIMIYDSFNGMAPGVQRFPLMTYDENVIYVGGSPNPEKAGLSPLDIERVKALYPKQHTGPSAKQARDANNTQATRPALEVMIPDLVTTTVSPVPTDFPKSVNDAMALAIARKYVKSCGARCSGDSAAW